MKEAIKRAVAEAAVAYGAEGYEVKMGSSTSAAVEALKDDISSVTYEKSTSISVRCVKGGKSGYASGNIVTADEAAELVRRACESALVVDDADEVPLFEGSPEYKKVEKKEVIIPSAEEMIKDTMDIQTKLMAGDKVVEGSQSFMQVSASESSFFNSAGLDLAYESGYVAKGAAAAVKDGDDAEENYEMKFADEITNDELVKLAHEGALAKLKEAHKNQDVAAIDTAINELNAAWQAASQDLYAAQQAQQAQGGAQQDPNAGQQGGAQQQPEDVEFEEVK